MSIAVVGLGGAGGNIANECSSEGIPVGAINFSQKDLESLDKVEAKMKVMGSDGVGHNRQLAIDLVLEHHGSITKFIKNNFNSPSIDVIFLPFACGGGSGSGIAPILSDILSHEMPDKVIVPMPILADETETFIAQANTYNAMSELSKLDLCILPIDNNQVRINHKVFKTRMFELTNQTAASLLTKISKYTEKSSKNGNFDNRDLITVFSQRGIGMISEAEIASLKSDVSVEGIANKIVESWEKSIFAPIEYQQVAKCAFIFDGQESLVEYIDYDKIFNKFLHGMPLDLFEGYYHEQNGSVITILTGLPWCNARMESIDRIIENEKNKAEIVINSMENDQFKPKTLEIDQKLRKNPQKSVKNGTNASFLEKYRR